ncbi:DUF2165 domain-containing protein [Streptomyces sp. IBSBF 2953]|uniref:DUF2165 domain-containing protein n=1 Tax=Streptomyces TaxID=1883 RepID=UPI00211A1021|nr:DUF2165 domain-containing protein [Streptomyces hayashii]
MTTPTARRAHASPVLPLTAALLTGTVALYLLLVAFGNITDFGTNQQFVRHVLAMDDTFEDDDLMWRAVTDKGLQDAAYVAIIAWETVAGLVLAAGTWFWARRDDLRARTVSTYGLVMVMLLFGAGFIAIGGEWFAMWQSKTWNGLDAATRAFLFAGVVLIVNHLPSGTTAATGTTTGTSGATGTAGTTGATAQDGARP